MREGFETLKNCYELTTQAGTKIFAILRRDLKCYKMTLFKNVAGLQVQSQGHDITKCGKECPEKIFSDIQCQENCFKVGRLSVRVSSCQNIERKY